MPPANPTTPAPAATEPGDWRALATRYMPLARKLAGRLHARAPSADRADFDSAAFEGLVDAARRWKPELSRSGRFGAFAAPRIVGAIKDWQRSTTVVSGGRWERERRRRQGLEVQPIIEHSYDALVDEAAALGRPLPERFRVEGGHHDTEKRLTLAALIARAPLTVQQRRVLEGRLGGRQLEDIAGELGVTGSRISQVEKEAIAVLREATDDAVVA